MEHQSSQFMLLLKKRLDDVTNMLSEEIGKASNVKDKVNRLSI